jgi:hypothetical protein
MVFNRAEPDANFFQRWVSTGGKWEIGFTRMMFGVRIRVGRVGSLCVDLDYCAGADVRFQEELMRVVMTILIPVSEEVTCRQLSDIFPDYEVRPIIKDKCWIQLQQMAATVLGGEKAS